MERLSNAFVDDTDAETIKTERLKVKTETIPFDAMNKSTFKQLFLYDL